MRLAISGVLHRLILIFRLEMYLWTSWLSIFDKLRYSVSRVKLLLGGGVIWCGRDYVGDGRLGSLLLPAYLREIDVLMKFVQMNCGDEIRVIDVGGNCGQFSTTLLAYCRYANIRVDLVVIEPNREIQGLLRNNLENSKSPKDRIQVLEFALGEAEGKETLSVVSRKSGQGSLLPANAHKGLLGKPEVETQQVVTLPIDANVVPDEWNQGGVIAVDLVKVDVEGWETSALGGLKSVDTRFLWLETELDENGKVSPEVMLALSKLGLGQVHDELNDQLIFLDGNVLASCQKTT